MSFKGRPSRKPTPAPAAPHVAAPDAPPTLDGVALEKWPHLCAALQSLGLLAKASTDIMALYCESFAEKEEAMDKLSRGKHKGRVLMSKEGGLYRSPWLDVKNHAAKEMQRLAKLLGLDAASQKRLGVKDTTEKPKTVESRDRSKGPPAPVFAGKIG